MNNNQFFKNDSLLKGSKFKQFDTPRGKIRAENKGGDYWSIFVLDGSKDSYVHDAIVRAKNTCKSIYAAWEMSSSRFEF